MSYHKECDATIQIDHLVQWIKEYFVRNGNENTKAVIGISGGKDSTIAAALLVRALGADRVVGVLMPNGTQSDIEDAYNVVRGLGIKHYVINIDEVMDTITTEIPEELFGDNNSIYYTNTPARIRMTILYAIAGLIGGRVCNTGNFSELYVGYTTKYGDLAGDFALFSAYTAREVVKIGELLEEIPEYLIHKAPADGMSGSTDEEKLGFTYEELDDYLLENKTPSYDKLRLIKEAHQRNIHKTCIDLPCPRKFFPRGEYWI